MEGSGRRRFRYQLGSRTKCLLDSAGWYPSHPTFLEKRALYISIPTF